MGKMQTRTTDDAGVNIKLGEQSLNVDEKTSIQHVQSQAQILNG